MIEKQDAAKVYEHALGAIRELSALLRCISGKCSEEEYSRIKKAVGLSIGRIQVDILEPINAVHPELNDLDKSRSE